VSAKSGEVQAGIFAEIDRLLVENRSQAAQRTSTKNKSVFGNVSGTINANFAGNVS
jgi:hypothetical protein